MHSAITTISLAMRIAHARAKLEHPTRMRIRGKYGDSTRTREIETKQCITILYVVGCFTEYLFIKPRPLLAALCRKSTHLFKRHTREQSLRKFLTFFRFGPSWTAVLSRALFPSTFPSSIEDMIHVSRTICVRAKNLSRARL